MNKIKRAVYPGTFDPVTNGHLDILTRASRLFDEIIVAVSKHSSKTTLFTLTDRLQLLNEALKTRKFSSPIRVEAFSGLLVSFARQRGVSTLVRGVRAISDFDYEFQMALMNRHQAAGIETVFLMPDEKYVYLSSSMIKEIARLKGNLGPFAPKAVTAALKKKFL